MWSSLQNENMEPLIQELLRVLHSDNRALGHMGPFYGELMYLYEGTSIDVSKGKL